jgi:RNA polymerase sigma factor (sigma-70 family)
VRPIQGRRTGRATAHRLHLYGVAIIKLGSGRPMNERTKHLRDGIKDQLAFLRRRLLQRGRSNRKDIDDLIQEGFLRLCRYQQEQKAPVRDPVAFLVDVVEKVHIERLRRATLTQRIFSDQPFEEVDCVDTGSSPEQDAEAHELIERIERTLATVNPRTREAFLLHRFGGMSYAKIAARLGISTQAVTNHIAKALLLIDNELLRE